MSSIAWMSATGRDQSSPPPPASNPASKRALRWRFLVRSALPSAEQVALGIVLGAVAVAFSNALAIEIALSWPPGGWGTRGLHHLFDLIEVMGLGAWLALIPACVAGFGRGPRWLAWGSFAGLSCAAMYLLLGQHLERQADLVFGGALKVMLYPLYLLLCGLAIPVAHVLGTLFAHLAWWRVVPLLASSAGLIVAHAILRDDYPGVHAAILWTSMSLLGASCAPDLAQCLERRGRRRLILAAGFFGLLAVAWPPPNRIRLELFREPGSVPAWVLAQTVWRAPGEFKRMEPPAIRHASVETLRRASEGLPESPVVVMVTVDAMRADALKRVPPGRFRQLAWLQKTGASFERAIAPGSQTSVSLTTLFSGRYFSQLRWEKHGKGSNRFLYAAGDESVRFPALLTHSGVGTASFLGLIFLGQRFGVTSGFAHEDVVTSGRRHASASAVFKPVIRYLQQLDQQAAFVYAHVMEPHAPYNRGRVKKGSEWERYLSEIEVVDDWLSKVVRLLRKKFRGRGYLIISADHGEAFGEHGTRFHTKTLYDELLRVPLIIWGPGIRAGRLQERVSLVDLGPTVLNLFRLPVPAEYMGVSLLPLLRGHRTDSTRPVVAEGRLRRAFYTADGLKVIEDTVHKHVEVYDVEADPAETRNLFDSDRSRVAPAVAALRSFFDAYTLREGGYSPPYKR